MFVQLIDFRLKPGHWDDFRALNEEWDRREGNRAPGYVSGEILRDSKDPNHVIMTVRFESKDKAQQNSNRPETNEWYRRLTSMTEGEPKFCDCDLAQEMAATRPAPERGAPEVYPQA